MPSFMIWSIFSGSATPSITHVTASLIIGMRMRLLTKPGKSFATTGTLPTRSVSAWIVS